MSEQPDARPGQVWADSDPRQAGRTLRVDSIEDGKAACTVLANSTEVQDYLNEVHGSTRPGQGPAPAGLYAPDRRGATTRIAVSRFKPGRTGFRLVSSAGT